MTELILTSSHSKRNPIFPLDALSFAQFRSFSAHRQPQPSSTNCTFHSLAADDVNSFKDYMDLTWKIGQRKGYPIQISDNGSLTGSAKAKLDIFGNFSIHAVILMCKERHVQPIVNTVNFIRLISINEFI